MLRKFARAVLPYASVRDEFKTAANSLQRGVRSLRMEWFASTLRSKQLRNIKLNIGCGAIIRDGWVNVDVYPHAGAFYLDVRNGLPLDSDQVTHIHCEHFLEHLSFDDAERFIRDCRRVLAPRGTMRIIVPDAAKYITAYCQNDTAFFGSLSGLGNASESLDTPIKVINQMFRMGGDHKFAWDFDTLLKIARAAGFSDVVKSSFGDMPESLAIDGTDEWRRIESLYAMATK